MWLYIECLDFLWNWQWWWRFNCWHDPGILAMSLSINEEWFSHIKLKLGLLAAICYHFMSHLPDYIYLLCAILHYTCSIFPETVINSTYYHLLMQYICEFKELEAPIFACLNGKCVRISVEHWKLLFNTKTQLTNVQINRKHCAGHATNFCFKINH